MRTWSDTAPSPEYNSLEAAERFAPRYPEFARQLEAKARPITTQELASELEIIVRAFPNGKAEGDFVAIMAATIAAMRPSVGAVQLARRELINKHKFLPAISEVREAIEKAARFLRGLDVNGFPEYLSRLRENHRRSEEDRKRQQAERRERLNR